MKQDSLRILTILMVWSFPSLTYYSSPRTIEYALVGLVIFVYSLTKLMNNEEGFIKISPIFSKILFGTSEIFAFLGVIFGFVIEANNLETDKKFIDFTLIDFIFPISLISFFCIPATFVLFEIAIKK
jgi:hypothetical protein